MNFRKLEELADILKSYEINLAKTYFVIYNDQFNEMRKISTIFINLMEILYKENNYYNKDLQIVSGIQDFSYPELSFSPLRFDFLIDFEGNLIVSDINLPGSFALDLYWTMVDNKNAIKKIEGIYAYFNAFIKYKDIIGQLFNVNFKILRLLELNTVKSEKQRQFIANLFDLLNAVGPIKLEFPNNEIDKIDLTGLSSKYIVSLFLNTHNSPENLLNSIKILIDSKKPIFANPKLLAFTDKKPPSLEFLQSLLKDNDADYLHTHLPKTDNQDGFIEKTRFGHSSSSYPNSLDNLNNLIKSSPYPYPKVRLEKLNALEFQGIPNIQRSGYDYDRFMFELSLNTFITTQKNIFKNMETCASVGCRGARSHPISGPNTLIFPALVEV